MLKESNNYYCEFLNSKEFHNLKTAWINLEKGKDMTFFQTYEWFEMLHIKNKKPLYKNKIFYAVIKDTKNNILLIAPLFVKTTILPLEYKIGVYFYGMGGFSDYSNFIYDDVDEEIFALLFKSVIERFNINVFYFDYLLDETQLYEYIKRNTLIEYDNKGECVKLAIPEDLDTYKKQLSKNARQNIRTAYNRIAKDGINYKVVFDDNHVNVAEFEKYRDFRIKKKLKMDFSLLFIKKKLLALFELLRKQTNNYYPYKDLNSSKFLTVIDVDKNRLMSAVNYGLSTNRRELFAMCVSLNEDYKRYSPGIIGWYEFILSNFGNVNLKYIDFTRGNENYKYVLGGRSHYSHFMKFRIK